MTDRWMGHPGTATAVPWQAENTEDAESKGFKMTTVLQRLQIKGHRFILMPETEYERLLGKAREAVPEDDLPSLPKPDRHGNYPALEYARISLARDLIRRRKGAGLTQTDLARRAGIRQETLSRIETGRHTPSVRVIDRIMDALETTEQDRRRGRRDHL